MSLVFRVAHPADAVDVRLLHLRDRAALRILDRAEVATPRQLAILVYGHRRIAQRRLAWLWQAGLLERTVLPPPSKGGAELAYRLSSEARHRLGDRSPRTRGSNRLRHTLDIVETVCALVTANGDPRTASPVAAWLPERMARTQLGGPPFPDSILVVDHAGRSGTICLEVDEETQRRTAIEAKLNGYRRLLGSNRPWVVVFVVPSQTRARWLRLVGSSVDENVARRTWVTTLAALQLDHLAALTTPLERTLEPVALENVLEANGSGHHRCPVASHAWIRLLGEGGVEDLEGVAG